MMKRAEKIISICLLVIALVSISTSVFAFDWSQISANRSGTSNIVNTGNNIVSIIRIGGMFISIGVLMILGIKYMMGSAEQKAEYKKTMIPYVVGALFIFAATFIVTTIYDFVN